MEKRKLAVVGIASVSLVIGMYVVLSNNKSLTIGEKIISKEQAHGIAEANLDLFESWKEPQLKETYIYYAEESVPSAYLFVVNDLYGKAGYITISASTRLKPVLDYSTNPETPYAQALKLRNELILGTNFSKEDVKIESFYFGNLDYIARYTFRESKDTRESTYLLSSTPQELSAKDFQLMFEHYKNFKAKDLKQAWQEYKIH